MSSNPFEFRDDEITGPIRLFPLPKLVMFPSVVQPLHIFEPRYRAMMREAIDTDRLITLATLAPGWEADYDGRPSIHPTVCIGRIASFQELPDGRFNLLLAGVARGRVIREAPPHKLFREAEVVVIKDVEPSDEKVVRSIREQILLGVAQVMSAVPGLDQQLRQIAQSNVSLGALVDIVAYSLDLPEEKKIEILSAGEVKKRAELVGSGVQDILCHLPPKYPYPPAFSAN